MNGRVVAPGVNVRLSLSTPQVERIAEADVVLAQLEVSIEVVRTAAAARKANAVMVLNAAPARDLPDDIWDALDLLVVNEHEAAELAHTPDPVTVLADKLLERVPALVVTLGGAGCVVAEQGHDPFHIPGIQADVVDTTGAGDTFCGVLAAALARGLSLTDAARLACAAGALAVTRPGAQDAVPTADEVAVLAAGGMAP